MNATLALDTPIYRAAEHHSFSAAGVDFWYLVPSGAIFALEGIGKQVIELLGDEAIDHDTLVADLLALGYSRGLAEAT